jgi:GNAT superfamily N-acetyltransferase
MQLVCLHDKTEIERFLRKNADLHIYSLGDLDEFFWPYTMWYASRAGGELRAVALLYVAQRLPTLLALSDQGRDMHELLEAVLHLLPPRFYAHLSPGLESVFGRAYKLDSHGAHYKMALRGPHAVAGHDVSGVVPLGEQDLEDLLDFYQRNYPGNWFDPRMLETNQYFGIREAGQLVSVAGIHVYSPQYGVAALGNVATHASYRGKGLGTRVTARVCQSLLEDVEHVGANVKADNGPAISCYRRLGFEIVASYGEFMVERT